MSSSAFLIIAVVVSTRNIVDHVINRCQQRLKYVVDLLVLGFTHKARCFQFIMNWLDRKKKEQNSYCSMQGDSLPFLPLSIQIDLIQRNSMANNRSLISAGMSHRHIVQKQVFERVPLLLDGLTKYRWVVMSTQPAIEAFYSIEFRAYTVERASNGLSWQSGEVWKNTMNFSSWHFAPITEVNKDNIVRSIFYVG